jgi:hypothetical protein
MTSRSAALLALLVGIGGLSCSDLTTTSNPIVATNLAFSIEPSNEVRDTGFLAPVTVRIVSVTGQLATRAANPVTLSIAVNPGHATLQGTTTVSATSGVASFPGIRMDSLGVGFRLVATSPGLVADTSTLFTVTLSLHDADGDGYSPSTGDCNDADSTVHPGAVDYPDPAHIDSNCDGLDGDRSKAIFVATTGFDSVGCGAESAPCRSIRTGIAEAVTDGKRDVYVAAGGYAGFTVADGVNVFGGFDDAYARAPGDVVVVGGHEGVDVGLPQTQAVTVAAVGLTKATIIADLRLVGTATATTDSDGTGHSSYGVLARAFAGGSLTVTRSLILAGAGAPGAKGADGTDAASLGANSPMNGGIGGAAKESTFTCENVSRGAGGQAGAPVGASTGGSRVAGAGGQGGTMDTDCSLITPDFRAQGGDDGVSATQLGTGAGHGGGGGSGSGTCGPTEDGEPGLVSNGGAGTGGTGGGSLSNGLWRGVGGQDGSLGDNGGGGGGGGGSGGCDNGIDSWGAGGGGGGAGGAKAAGAGGGGAAGGGWFGIYVSDAAVTATSDSILIGPGGKGGDGGVGGQGQSGGVGGAGGAKAPNGAAAGNGGHGGHGGHGGGGGGGAGGNAYGIYLATAGSLVTNVGNTFVGGTAGAGGIGGLSAPNAILGEQDGNAGTVGALGVVGNVGSCSAPGGC